MHCMWKKKHKDKEGARSFWSLLFSCMSELPELRKPFSKKKKEKKKDEVKRAGGGPEVRGKKNKRSFKALAQDSPSLPLFYNVLTR